MAYATQPTRGAGAFIEYEDPANAGTYKQLGWAIDFPELGEQGAFIAVTPIKDEVPLFIAGDKQVQEFEFGLYDVPGDANQQEFEGLAQNRDTVSMKFTYKSGRVGTVDIVLNGFRISKPEREEANKIIIYCQQSGSVTWSATA